ESFAGGLRAFLVEYKVFQILNLALLAHFVGGISLGATVLIWRFLTNRQVMVRQRLKWAMWGTILSVIPIIGVQTAKQ
ncbi:hypothetical protein, partial [Vibrio parahaemolyticus]|uniref:hypothetical protein n=1 Tax=Vibrio parahaemolyticus TaxID=670 RepID=UPI001A8D857B